MTPEDIIQKLHMAPHPEGGFYAETFRDTDNLTPENRSASTAIYYLLLEGQISHWHRVDAAEVWHYYAGSPLKLSIAKEGQKANDEILGSDLLAGARPQIVVKKGDWQSARSLGEWTLVGCTVAPGFEFSGFEMAPEIWTPSDN
ncbi:MAG: cupin domain-containing protein [Sneathiella sp.]|nr:cupin domain-containing protein [Sneathiella sp.]